MREWSDATVAITLLFFILGALMSIRNKLADIAQMMRRDRGED